VIKKLSSLTGYVLWFSYLSLAIITPLIFTTNNSELFEVPKMHFVYLIAIVLLFGTIFKFLLARKVSLPTGLPVLAFVIFVFVQIISAFTSIDKFTSIFGYPSRLNGGLLSQFAYLIIFASALVNLNPDKVKKLLLGFIFGAIGVSVWGIPAHFGYDPSCLVFARELTSSCWQKEFDPTLRIFSTLGQPNWLASYLVIVLPISIYMAIATVRKNQKIFFFASSIVIFTALVMTNSRAGILGMFFSIIILFLLNLKTVFKNKLTWALLIFSFALITSVFGKFLFERFFEAKDSIQKQSAANQIETSPAPLSQAQGTESGEIRLIVWQGALQAFKAKPVFGHGPETFAYSYYKFRPASHNATTEWNFFYNKAHNEFLNYLANIGLAGTLAYVIFLLSTILILLRSQNGVSGAVIAAAIGYHTTIFFGFSIVATQTSMFLLFAAALSSTNMQKFKTIKINPEKNGHFILLIIAGLLFLIAISFVTKLYFADLFFAKAKSASSSKNYVSAIETFPLNNPFYQADYSYNLASLAIKDERKESREKYLEKVKQVIREAENASGNNLIVERRVANSYLLLGQISQESKTEAIKTATHITALAPSDPQSFITLSKTYLTFGELKAAKKAVEKALELKPGLIEGLELLDQLNLKIVEELTIAS